jgi:hypothetical protein
MNRVLWPAVAGAVLIVAGLAWWLWSEQAQDAPEPPPPVAQVEPAAPMPEPAAPVEPVIRHPIEPPAEEAPAVEAPASEEPADPDARLVAAVTGVLGRASVLQWLQTDAFIGRIVATVDNLPRAHAAAQRWPVVPVPGRFEVAYRDGEIYAAPGNERRYDGLVQTLTAMDPARAAAMYRRLYPQFQAAYEQLGFPNRYFNDRVVEAIDDLLAAPEAPLPLPLTLTEVRGEVESTTPWLRYEYADKALEARSAGQRMMMRIGPGHQRTLAAWLRQFRAQIAR